MELQFAQLVCASFSSHSLGSAQLDSAREAPWIFKQTRAPGGRDEMRAGAIEFFRPKENNSPAGRPAGQAKRAREELLKVWPSRPVSSGSRIGNWRSSQLTGEGSSGGGGATKRVAAGNCVVNQIGARRKVVEICSPACVATCPRRSRVGRWLCARQMRAGLRISQKLDYFIFMSPARPAGRPRSAFWAFARRAVAPRGGAAGCRERESQCAACNKTNTRAAAASAAAAADLCRRARAQKC